jgi:hypothetical protein
VGARTHSSGTAPKSTGQRESLMRITHAYHLRTSRFIEHRDHRASVAVNAQGTVELSWKTFIHSLEGMIGCEKIKI